MTTGKTSGALGNVGSDSSVIGALHPTLSHPIKVGFSESMDTVFLLGAVVCALGAVVLLFLPDLTLSDRSAMATAADERARSMDPLPADASTEDRELHAGLQKFLLDAAAAETGGHTLEEILPGVAGGHGARRHPSLLTPRRVRPGVRCRRSAGRAGPVGLPADGPGRGPRTAG